MSDKEPTSHLTTLLVALAAALAIACITVMLKITGGPG